MKRLQDRVAIITGSARGFGFAIAEGLAEEGAKVVLTDVFQEGLDEAVKTLRGKGHQAMGLKVDVTNKSQVQALAKTVKDSWGGIDILVNCAGGGLGTPFGLQEIEEKHWDLVVDVNLKGTFFCCQAVIPVMAEKKKGAIVNISALAAHYRATMAGVQYTAAKAGVEGLTRQLAYDFGPDNIRINAVAPTVTLTGDRTKGLWEDKTAEERAKTVANIPLRRLSEPREVVAAVIFLASDEASYITGITLDVVGGRYLR
ncbi:MAG: SDR family oxidoreductase [Spirochaetia bacterium]|jgi:NAD(P)-dependent dehydrogenase (short-subunit alcohol dehydrogenase family)|nr:SDR family oxidoreductase [Spirochaetia bacterium]MCE1208298.1 SDR family oxidoreductase [Spirochaetia bacterium]